MRSALLRPFWFLIEWSFAARNHFAGNIWRRASSNHYRNSQFNSQNVEESGTFSPAILFLKFRFTDDKMCCSFHSPGK